MDFSRSDTTKQSVFIVTIVIARSEATWQSSFIYMSLRGAKRRGNLMNNNMLRLPRCARNDNFPYQIATLPAVARNDIYSCHFGTSSNK